MPKIFHVNWFRKSKNDGKYIWPGFGQNIRVLQWMMERIDGNDQVVEKTAVGWLPKSGTD